MGNIELDPETTEGLSVSDDGKVVINADLFPIDKAVQIELGIERAHGLSPGALGKRAILQVERENDQEQSRQLKEFAVTHHLLGPEALDEDVDNVIDAAYSAYENALEIRRSSDMPLWIDNTRVSADEQAFRREALTWAKRNNAGQCKDIIQLNPDQKFTFMAVPNVLLMPEDLTTMAMNFGLGQSVNNSKIDEESLELYSSEDLTGYNLGLPINFMIVADSPCVTDEQSDLIAEHKGVIEGSILADIIRLYTLRNLGKLFSMDVIELTTTHHTEMETKKINGIDSVPRVMISRQGQLCIEMVPVNDSYPSRIQLG